MTLLWWDVDDASFDARVSAVNSTFAGNSANQGQAIWIQGGSLELKHCTVSANNTGTLAVVSFIGARIENCILAGNSAGDIYEATVLHQSGNNFMGGNPLLAPLNSYGGPTATMPPMPGSPAIESAVLLASTPLIDQRGAPRPAGPLPDLGAVEAVSFGSLGLVSADGDSIPDVLEGPGGPYPHLSPFVNDSGVDTDGDGSPDGVEIANMTDPYDPASVLRITHFGIVSTSPGSTTVEIEFISFPGLHYTAEVSQTIVFTSPRGISLGNPAEFLSAYNLLLAPTEIFVRIRRD